MQAVDDRPRRAGRREDAEPDFGRVAGHAGLRDRRDIRQCGGAPRRGDRDRPQAAGLQMRHDVRHVVEAELHVAGQDVGDGGRRALVRHVQHVHAGHDLEHLAGQVLGAAVAGRREGQGAGRLLGQGDQLPDRFRRHRRMHDQHVGDRPHHRHRREVPHRVVGQRRVDRRGGRVCRRAAHHDRVAVRGRAGHLADAERSGRAGPVLDDHRLAQRRAQAARDQAAEGVVAAAWRPRADQLDRLRRIGLGRRGQRLQRETGGGQHGRAGEGEGGWNTEWSEHDRTPRVACRRTGGPVLNAAGQVCFG